MRKFLLYSIFVIVCAVPYVHSFWILLPDKETDRPSDAEIKTPVVLVPGTGGSQLQAKLNKPSTKHWYCSKTTSDYFTLWLKKSSLLPLAINCWVDNMRLVYHKSSNTVTNAPGVFTRTPGFGDTDTVEYLDTDHLVKYMAPLVQSLVSWGYERGVSVRAAPYDFRFAPGNIKFLSWGYERDISVRSAPFDFDYAPDSSARVREYFVKLKSLIEETYATNNNKRVSLLSHSMGCPYTLVFLNSQTKAWKDKFILQWITLSGVWGGTAMQMQLYSSGNTLGIPHFLVDPLTIRGQQRTYTSNAYLMPSREFWSVDEVLVTTPQRNYTINDFREFFKDIDFPEGINLVHNAENLTYPLASRAPNVTVHCFYGTGVATPESFTFTGNQFPDTEPAVTNGNGDGTVNLRSLKGCERWIGRQQSTVVSRQFPSVNHDNLLKDEHAHALIKTLLML